MIEATYWARIYSSGPIDVAKQTIREHVLQNEFCVTIEPTTFIFVGGEEQGFVVGLVNYPRFPVAPDVVRQRARNLALVLMRACAQRSVLVQAPDRTEWIRREDV